MYMYVIRCVCVDPTPIVGFPTEAMGLILFSIAKPMMKGPNGDWSKLSKPLQNGWPDTSQIISTRILWQGLITDMHERKNG